MATVTLSQKSADYFRTHPEVYATVKPFMDNRPWDPSTDLQTIEIVTDDFTRAILKAGEPEMELLNTTPDDYETYEIRFNDEIVFFVIHDEVIVNRIDSDTAKLFAPSINP